MSTRLRDAIEAILGAHKSHGNFVYPTEHVRQANMVGLLVDLHDAYRVHLGSPQEALSAWIFKEFKDTGMDLQDFAVEIAQVSVTSLREYVDVVCTHARTAGQPKCVLRSEVYSKDTQHTRYPWDLHDPAEMSRRMVATCAPEIAAAVGRLGYPARLHKAVLFVGPRHPMLLQWCLVVIVENTQRSIVAVDLGNPLPSGDFPVVTTPAQPQGDKS